jgi:hypothetical protein
MEANVTPKSKRTSATTELPIVMLVEIERLDTRSLLKIRRDDPKMRQGRVLVPKRD